MVPGGGGVSRDVVVSDGDVVLGDGVVLGLAVLGTFVVGTGTGTRADEGQNTADPFKSIYKQHA